MEYRNATDKQMDRQTELLYQYRVSVLTRDIKRSRIEQAQAATADSTADVQKLSCSVVLIVLPAPAALGHRGLHSMDSDINFKAHYFIGLDFILTPYRATRGYVRDLRQQAHDSAVFAASLE